MNDMYAFLLNMWVMKKINEAYLTAQVTKGRITEEEKAMILATPQLLNENEMHINDLYSNKKEGAINGAFLI